MLSRYAGLWMIFAAGASWFEPGVDGIGPPGCIQCNLFKLGITIVSVVLGAVLVVQSFRAPQQAAIR